MKCIVPNCNNDVSYNTALDKRKSKTLCEEHRNGIPIKCSICDKIILKRASAYFKIKEKDKYICSKCFKHRKRLEALTNDKRTTKISN